MTEGNKVTTNTIFIFGLLIILVSAFFVYNSLNKKTFKVLEAVPTDAAFIIEFNSLNRLEDKISHNQMWADLKNHPKLKFIDRQIHLFDSVAYKYTKISEKLKNGHGILSSHFNNGKYDQLLVMETEHQLGFTSIDGLFEEMYHHEFTRIQIKYEGERIKNLIFNQYNQSFSYSIVGNIFMGSFSEELIKRAIHGLKANDNLSKNKDLIRLRKSSGKNVDANFFLNAQTFNKFISKLAHPSTDSFCSNLTKYFSWIGLDIILKENELLMHGYTNIKDSTNYLFTFYNQEPQLISLTGILSYNTTLLLHKSFSDYSLYFNDYKTFLKANQLYDEFSKGMNIVNKETMCNLEKFIIPFIGNEIALVSYAEDEKKFYNNTYAIIKAKDDLELKRRFKRISEKVNSSGLVKQYRGQEIYRINAKNICEYLLGGSFKAIDKFNFTFINGYMVIGNSIRTLESFIDLYQSGKTLDLNKNYKDFTDNINEKSNLYLYYNIRNGFNLLKNYIHKDLYIQLSSPDIDITNFHAAGFQLSNTSNNLFTNIYLKYNEKIVEENRSQWKTVLDAEIKGQPFAVKDHRNNTHNIITFDIDNNIYLFNPEGNRLWKKEIKEEIQSPVYIVDYYKNGKYQYLFNTKNYLYLIDLLGRDVSGYPVKLRSSATNALALFDYDNNKNYRIVLAGSDKKIYNYNINGLEVNGWRKYQTLNIVNQQIQHLRANGKDYILVSDNKGIVRILNRLGKDRIILKKQFKKSTNSSFYINQTNSKGLFITTDKKGALIYIGSDGKIDKTIFDEFSEDHYFLYEDYNKDGHKDFIYLDGNKLRIYNRFKKLIFSYNFKSKISQKPEFYDLSRSKSILGIVSKETQEIFLFNKSGNVLISKGLIGETPFIIQRLKNNWDLNLIVGSGSSLYNYIIK